MSLAALVQTALSLLPAVPAPPAAHPPPVTTRSGSLSAVARAAVDQSPRHVAPLPGDLVVLDPFRPPERPWLPGHRGVDLLAAPGTEVLASGAGIVLWSGLLAGRGVVSVLHGDGRRTTYEPVEAEVGIGDLVGAGTRIGRIGVGTSHCAGVVSCLHWGLLTATDDYLDPLSLLGPAGRPRLLPLGAGVP
jgi:murein DD-endopeptidase MepM/ murein hydrolase activator NlpD